MCLGMDDPAYHRAAGEMGHHLITLCLLVIDVNKDHSFTPVRNVGGLLRAMTCKYNAGQLNIAGSLIGLSDHDGAGLLKK